MSSTTSLAARQYRLNQWAEQIRDCNNRPEGMSVKEWCSQQGITKANYYYRLRQVRKACLETIPEELLPQSIVPVPHEIMGAAPEVPSASELEFSVNGFYIHVTENTTPELLTMVLEVASHAK